VKAIDLVVSEALSRGLQTERLPVSSKKHKFDPRLLLIEGKRCQVIPSKVGHPSKKYLHAKYLSLYLPRAKWPDYLIYVLPGEACDFWIVPRVELSKDTCKTPQSIERYRGAWEALRQELNESPKEFEVLSWQLEAVKAAAQIAGLRVEFIPTKKYQKGRRWPPVLKRRVFIEGRKCSIFSAARISQDHAKREYNYAIFKASPEGWCDFQIFVVKDFDKAPDIFVMPRNQILKTTSASLNHPELKKYKNAWSLLTAPDGKGSKNNAIEWRNR
jgi:hypothetical protein